jgi:hypothetical protein
VAAQILLRQSSAVLPEHFIGEGAGTSVGADAEGNSLVEFEQDVVLALEGLVCVVVSR